MFAQKTSQESGAAAPSKRSLFNKPSWSKPRNSSNDTDLFHRSNQTYIDQAAEADRERKKKLARKRSGRVLRIPSEGSGERRRISDDEAEDDRSSSVESLHYSRNENVSTTTNHNKPELSHRSKSPQEPVHSPTSLLKRYEAKVAANRLYRDQTQAAQVSAIIDLDHEDSSLDSSIQRPTINAVTTKPPQAHEDDDLSVSDEEFPELARKAREKARRKRFQEDITTAIRTPDYLALSKSRESRHHSCWIRGPTPPPSSSDPVLHILITSKIENTGPLIVSRRISQRMKDVRLAWAERQHFSPSFMDKVFLTWQGKRLFDVTSCKSLGITVDMNREVFIKGERLGEGGQIHVEAMTAEILEAYKNYKLRDTATENDSSVDKVVADEPMQEAQVKVILKAKGFDDFKLIVKPSTMISKVINAFRSQNQISMEQEVFLSFDGDRLQAQCKVEETELSDMDCIDVIIRN